MLSTNILCTLAKSDASHDFGSKMVSVAAESIPGANSVECIHYGDEDELLKKLIGLVRDTSNINKDDKGEKSGIPFILPSGSTDKISEDYNVILYESFENLDDILKRELTMDGNIFFIIDTPGGIIKPLINLGKAGKARMGPTYYCIQNRQTLYDPAGKSDPSTTAGKEIWRNNQHVKFAWEDTTPGQFTKGELYPSWNLGKNVPDKGKLDTQNKLFYCKNDVFQILESTSPQDYTSQATKCIMKMPDGGVVVMNKEMAKISGGSFTAGEYKALFNELKDTITALFNKSPLPEKFADKHHCPAKRLGDQGQALSCLKDKIALKYFPLIDGVAEKRAEGVQNIISNGNHCFVTIDRPALCAALLYRVPMILYSYYGNDNFALFIHKSLQTPELLFENNKAEYARYWALMNDKIRYFEGKKIIYDGYINKIKQDIFKILDTNVYKTIVNKMPGAKYKVGEVEYEYKFKYDTEETHFRRLVINLFKYLKHMEFINTLRDSNTNYNMGTYPSVEEISRLTLGGAGKRKREENVVAVEDSVIQKIKEALSKIKADFTGFNSIVAAYDTLEELSAKVPTIDVLNKSNIEASGLFGISSGGSRTFVPKYEENTLREYIKTIISALQKTFPDLVERFVGLIKNILKLVEIHSYDKNKGFKIAYLRELSLLNVKNNSTIGGGIRGGGISGIRGGGNITNTDKYNEIYKDAIIRTAFAILISSEIHTVEKGLSTVIKAARTGDIFTIETLKRIYDKLVAEPVSVVNNDYSEGEYDDVAVDESPYYIDFIEGQISRDEGLRSMYYNLINEGDIIVPPNIVALLQEFLGIRTSSTSTPFYKVPMPSIKPRVRFGTMKNLAKIKTKGKLGAYTMKRNFNKFGKYFTFGAPSENVNMNHGSEESVNNSNIAVEPSSKKRKINNASVNNRMSYVTVTSRGGSNGSKAWKRRGMTKKHRKSKLRSNTVKNRKSKSRK